MSRSLIGQIDDFDPKWRSKVAEGVGFEPTIGFPLYTLSKRAPSTARPPLLGFPRGGRKPNRAATLLQPSHASATARLSSAAAWSSIGALERGGEARKCGARRVL